MVGKLTSKEQIITHLAIAIGFNLGSPANCVGNGPKFDANAVIDKIVEVGTQAWLDGADVESNAGQEKYGNMIIEALCEAQILEYDDTGTMTIEVTAENANDVAGLLASIAKGKTE